MSKFSWPNIKFNCLIWLRFTIYNSKSNSTKTSYYTILVVQSSQTFPQYSYPIMNWLKIWVPYKNTINIQL